MKVFTLITCIVLNLSCFGQQDTAIIPPVKLDGPRVGVTYIAPGTLADELRDRWDADPVVTQFGWQFEMRYFTLNNGTAGLVEFVPLVAGLEQGLFLPSLSCLVGLRSGKGTEFGFGPNITLDGASFVLAFGHTFKSQHINFPLNLAIVPARSGTRFTLLFGFNARH